MNNIIDMPDRPIDPPDVQDVLTCEDCGAVYPDDTWCKDCHLFPPTFKIEAEVDEHDAAFLEFCMKEHLPTDLHLLKLAFLAGASHGVDMALEAMK